MRQRLLHKRGFNKVIFMEKRKKIFFVLALILLLALISAPVFAPSGTGARYNTKTVVFYLNSSTPAIAVAAAAWNNFTATLSLPDTDITVLNAYLAVAGSHDNTAGSGAATIDVYLNNTLIGKNSLTRLAEAAGFEILANASRNSAGNDFYSLSSTPQLYAISILCNGQCNELSTRAFITYKYDPPAKNSEVLKETPVTALPTPPKEKSIFQKIREKILTLLGIEKIFL